jgi:hypothetical protein
MTVMTIHAGRAVPLVDSNERARQLQVLDARILLGPLPTRDGKSFLVPSPRYHQAAIADWHLLGGHFERRDNQEWWLIPVRAGWLRVDEIYRRHFAIEIRDAGMRLAMANYTLRCKVEARLQARRQMYLEQEQG